VAQATGIDENREQPRWGDIVLAGVSPGCSVSKTYQTQIKSVIDPKLPMSPLRGFGHFQHSTSGLRQWLNYFAPTGAYAQQLHRI
jgi:hypothetical protein